MKNTFIVCPSEETNTFFAQQLSRHSRYSQSAFFFKKTKCFTPLGLSVGTESRLGPINTSLLMWIKLTLKKTNNPNTGVHSWKYCVWRRLNGFEHLHNEQKWLPSTGGNHTMAHWHLAAYCSPALICSSVYGSGLIPLFFQLAYLIMQRNSLDFAELPESFY